MSSEGRRAPQRGVEAESGGVAGTTGVAFVHQKPMPRIPAKIAAMKPPSMRRRIIWV